MDFFKDELGQATTNPLKETKSAPAQNSDKSKPDGAASSNNSNNNGQNRGGRDTNRWNEFWGALSTAWGNQGGKGKKGGKKGDGKFGGKNGGGKWGKSQNPWNGWGNGGWGPSYPQQQPSGQQPNGWGQNASIPYPNAGPVGQQQFGNPHGMPVMPFSMAPMGMGMGFVPKNTKKDP